MRSLVFAVVVTTLSQLVIKTNGQGCLVSNEEKLDCGFKGVNRRQCLEQGCCWVPCRDCDSKIPWCFQSVEALSELCSVSYEDKEDCGHYQIQKDECLQRGCCWKPSKRPNDPWCYTAKQVTTTTSTTTTTTVPTTTEIGNEGDIRLANGDYAPSGVKISGRVEIYHEGFWGTICDDSFGEEDAKVVCRQLGLYGGRAHKEAAMGEGSGPIWMDEVGCNGDEDSLTECYHSDWGDNDCSHLEDVSVTCTEEEIIPIPGEEGEVRLVCDSDTCDDYLAGLQGRVEIYHESMWGTVCDDSFGTLDAQVVCRQLGLREGNAHGGSYFGEGTGNIWLDEVACSGDEETLAECLHAGWGMNDCGHSEDVGVICSSAGETTTQEPGSEEETSGNGLVGENDDEDS